MAGVPLQPLPTNEGGGLMDLLFGSKASQFWPELGRGAQDTFMSLLTSTGNALMAPGNAAAGNYDQVMIGPDGSVSPFDPRMVDDAAGLAGLIGVGAAPVPRPSNSLGMFGGVKAATADKAALAQAEKMAADGASRDAIWNATGWFKGADGKWRFEIPDNVSHMKGSGTPSELADRWGSTVGDVMFHPDLFDAYPATGQIGFDALPDYFSEGMRGGFRPGSAKSEPMLMLNENIGQNARSTALHELQHAVQGEEGFARGSSPSEYASGPMFDKTAQSLKGDLSKALTGSYAMPVHDLEWIVKISDPAQVQGIVEQYGFKNADEAIAYLKQQDELRTPTSQYRRTAGEVEARNVQKRMDMTPEQRKASPPWATQDVPDNQQIVRFPDATGGLAQLLKLYA